MASVAVDIYNLALSQIGVSGTVGDVAERSVEAIECTRWYDRVRKQILMAAPWDCAKATKYLSLESTRDTTVNWASGAPAPGWLYEYRIPSDMLRPRYLDGYRRFDLAVNSDNKRVINSNTQQALLTYIKNQDDVAVFDIDLELAISSALAAHVALKLTGSMQQVRLATAQALDKITLARNNAANNNHMQEDSIPEWIAARGYEGAPQTQTYIYPFAEFSVATYAAGVVTNA